MAKVDVIDPKTGEVLLQRELPYLDENGREVLDSRPMAPPIGWHKQPSMIDNMRAMVRSELSRRAQEQGFETFAEADDFDLPDDPLDPGSEWENEFDPPIAEIIKAGKEAMREKQAAAAQKTISGELPEGQPKKRTRAPSAQSDDPDSTSS